MQAYNTGKRRVTPTCMRLRLVTVFTVFLCLFVVSGAQLAPEKAAVELDSLIPAVPAVPVSEWKDAPGRKAVSLRVDAVTLRGFQYAGANPHAPELLFFNGLGMSISHADRLYRALAALGPTVNVYDYRGWALSGGTSSVAAFRSDGLKLYDSLSQSGNHKVIVYGASMGTAVAAFIASQRKVNALVLGMPIATAEEELPVYGQLVGFSKEQLAGMEPSKPFRDMFGETVMVAQSEAPLLVLGGERDRVVPVKQAQEVFASSPSTKKKIVVVPGADHNDVIISPAAMSALNEFLSKL